MQYFHLERMYITAIRGVELTLALRVGLGSTEESLEADEDPAVQEFGSQLLEWTQRYMVRAVADDFTIRAAIQTACNGTLKTMQRPMI